MATHTCHDCDFPGDGNCSVCHGKGKTLKKKVSGAVVVSGYESACFACGGGGECQTCGGTGGIEVGGEG